MHQFTPTTGFVGIGDFFVCNCGIPLVKRTGLHEYEWVKFHNGQRVAIKTQFDGEIMRIKCQKCGRGLNYIQLKESISIGDNVRVANTPASDRIEE